MADNKNQHYVPRCHFKPFSLNGDGLAINLYSHALARAVPNAPIRGQCAKSYFYGRDLQLERILQSIEGDYASIVKKILDTGGILTLDERESLKNFAFLQMNRTEAATKKRALAVTALDELAHRGFENSRREIMNTSHDKMLIDTMATYLDVKDTIADLEVALLYNMTDANFITSDDPAMMLNKVFAQRLGGRPSGTVSTGAQLIMPISSKFYLICYDPAAYIPKDIQGGVIPVRSVKDVLALNELQILHCQRNVYFETFDDLDQIRRLSAQIWPNRPKSWLEFWVGVRDVDKNGNEYYRRASESEKASSPNRLISQSPVAIIPSRWISVLDYRAKVYGYTNGSGVGYVREGQRMSFGLNQNWMEEVKYSSKQYQPPKTAYVKRK